MLDREELDKYGPPGFHLGQKEKDYVQHWVLSFFSQSGFGGIFKGGTALQKAFNLPRYSEDLDFTLNEAEIPAEEKQSAFLSAAGFSGLSWKKESNDTSETLKLRFQGPLYNGSTVSEGTIRLEFSKREKTLLEPSPIMITPPYPDILPYQIKVMAKDEMAAEKVRAVLTRNSARDMFDLYFLLHQKAKLQRNIVEKKLEYYKLSFDYEIFEKKAAKLKVIWKKEISALTKNTLDYGFVSKQVLDGLGEI